MKNNLTDSVLIYLDRALKTVTVKPTTSERRSPAFNDEEPILNEKEQQLSAQLMRVNHCGEICAQALYSGQTLSVVSEEIKEQMQQAAKEEEDHLAWCHQRLEELNSKPSVLNPLFYSASFILGYAAGRIGDKVSLGFIGATEEQVRIHLEQHLQRLPEQDSKSKKIIEQMIVDEQKHENTAYEHGGVRFSQPIQIAMKLFSKIMTATTEKM